MVPSSRACSARLSARPRRLASASLPSRSISCRSRERPLAFLCPARRGDRFPTRGGELFRGGKRLGGRFRSAGRRLRDVGAGAFTGCAALAPDRAGEPVQLRRCRRSAAPAMPEAPSSRAYSRRVRRSARERCRWSARPRPRPATPSGGTTGRARHSRESLTRPHASHPIRSANARSSPPAFRGRECRAGSARHRPAGRSRCGRPRPAG